MQPIQMQISQKQKAFSETFVEFLKSILSFKDFRENMTLIVNVFPKLWTPKNVLR